MRVEFAEPTVAVPWVVLFCERPRAVAKAPFGQNLVYDCHAVYTTTRIRAELGIRPRYTLASGLAQTFEWYRREGLDRRAVEFSQDDALLAAART